MPRARKTVATVGASGAQCLARTKRSRRTKRKPEIKDGMGGTASLQDDDPTNKENPTSLQITMMSSSAEILPQPEEQDHSRKCPVCSSFLKPAVVPAGRTTSLLQCTRCSATPLCEHCLYPCPDGTCTNQSCPVISLLLTCDQVTDPKSKVCGCPLFRACPKCHNLMMHETGCKYVTCPQCKHGYCFICLRNRGECIKDKNTYWSLTCSAPTAARQRFQT